MRIILIELDMSNQVTTAFVQMYSANLQHLSQQKGSRLRGLVRNEAVRGKSAFFDQIGSQVASVRTTRGADTILNDTPHARRRVTLADYEVADLIDDQDKLRMIVDPTSTYAQAQAFAIGRAMDDVIITAATGTASTGETGSSSVTLAAYNSGSQIVAKTVRASGSGSTGLNIEKLRQAKFLMDNASVDPSIPRVIVVGPKQIQDLLATTEITSSDFNTVKALAQGQVTDFLGFNFVTSTRLSLDSSADVRSCFAYAVDGLLLAVGKDLHVRIDERPDKSYATQVYAAMSIGATRMEEDKVVQIECDESP
tara:strand:+ start:1951 stop:2880 length:930 start_codon:yes stop_codon:yes gene_type:complete